MVQDKSPDGSVRHRYLIYDVMQIEVSDVTLTDQPKIGLCLQKNQEVALCDHKTRLLCASRELIEPRDEAVSQLGKYEHSEQEFLLL